MESKLDRIMDFITAREIGVGPAIDGTGEIVVEKFERGQYPRGEMLNRTVAATGSRWPSAAHIEALGRALKVNPVKLIESDKEE